MKITWLGHSAFRIETAQSVILIDPYLSENPSAADLDIKEAVAGVTHIALTHGHFDHVGDTIKLAKETEAKVIANADLSSWLGTRGVKNIEPGNTGGTVVQNDFSVTFVNALHSSAFITEDGMSQSLGSANGLVFHINGEKTVYHMGDTDIFSDMALINELHQPEIGIVPIGDRFTMGGAVAALACHRYMNFSTVLPCHYATFPLLDPNADKFIAAMENLDTENKTKINVTKPGELQNL